MFVVTPETTVTRSKPENHIDDTRSWVPPLETRRKIIFAPGFTLADKDTVLSDCLLSRIATQPA